VELVQHSLRTTSLGDVTGAGFNRPVGDPGGRPEGLSRRVRELVGDDGHEIAGFMFGVLSNEASGPPTGSMR
jgi:hypothetical protein